MTPPRRRRYDSRAVLGSSIDDPGRFMSTAIDWRRVFTAVLVGIPCAVAVYAGTTSALEVRIAGAGHLIEEAKREARERDARTAAQFQREIDAIRQDVRELRTQITGKR